MVVLKHGNTDATADPVQPKEGPLGPHVEHLVGVDRDHLPTGITNYDLSERFQEVTEEGMGTVVVVVVVRRIRSRRLLSTKYGRQST